MKEERPADALMITLKQSESVFIPFRPKAFQSFSITKIKERPSKSCFLIQISSVGLPEQVYADLQSKFSFHCPKPTEGKKIVFVLGGPGSGKGTQCNLIVKSCYYAHVSTGDLLREEVKRKTALGQQLESEMKEGKMISQASEH